MRLIAVAATTACLLFATPAFAETDTTALVAACEENGLGFVGEENADKLSPFCGCLGTQFSPLEEKDVAILTTDIQGTTTPEDRDAHGGYEALEEQARDAVNTCFTEAGMPERAD